MCKPLSLLIVCVSLLLASAPVSAQSGQRQPAGRGPRPAPPVPTNVEQDEALVTIKGAVSPTDAQMQRIVKLYTILREDQRRMMHDARRNAGRDARRSDPPTSPGAKGDPGRAGRGNPDQPGAGPDRRRRDLDGSRRGGRERMQQIRTQIEALNTQFLTECRSLLSAEQHASWDACAADLNLRPRRARGGGRRDASRGPQVGQTAPAFELTDLNGTRVSLASLRGKPVVLEFGSYTCPAFRRQVDRIESVRKTYGDAVHWVLVYTKEAHPTDGRVAAPNTRAGIEIPQHKTFDDRLASAKRCKEELNLELLLLVDDFENKVAEAYSGHPNRGFVIDAGGTIVSRQVWIDVDETRQALEKVLKRKPLPPV